MARLLNPQPRRPHLYRRFPPSQRLGNLSERLALGGETAQVGVVVGEPLEAVVWGEGH